MSIYKYLPGRYAEAFVERGELLFRSIQYFLSCEDARRDELEGTHQFSPTGGLLVTNYTQGFRKIMPGSAMRSSVKYPEAVFVFCASHNLLPELALRFSTDACVEVIDIDKLIDRIRGVLRRNPQVKMRTIRTGSVKYYNTAEPPEATWALPDEIIMHKRLQGLP